MTFFHRFDAAAVAQRLLQARRGGPAVPHAEASAPDARAAFAVQDLTLAGLGGVGGWKVGAKGPDLEPACAPLPSAGVLPSGAALQDPAWRLRGVEVEVALLLGKDLVPDSADIAESELRGAVDAVLPVIEVVETRLADWRDSAPLAQLADLQSHGALVVGERSAMAPADLDLRNIVAYLAFDGQPVASTCGANPAADVWRLLGWLAWHCARRGQPLRRGQLVTTGSCTGMLFAPEGARVQAELTGIGRVDLRF